MKILQRVILCVSVASSWMVDWYWVCMGCMGSPPEVNDTHKRTSFKNIIWYVIAYSQPSTIER